jgi:hypothetical protein
VTVLHDSVDENGTSVPFTPVRVLSSIVAQGASYACSREYVRLCVVINGVFFRRCCQESRDQLFAMFAFAFWLFCGSWAILAVFSPTGESLPYVYALRLLAFLLLISGIVQKTDLPPGAAVDRTINLGRPCERGRRAWLCGRYCPAAAQNTGAVTRHPPYTGYVCVQQRANLSFRVGEPACDSEHGPSPRSGSEVCSS